MSDGISIIIPVYNAENCLKVCLESVIRQTFKNLEIICVLDENTDDKSEDILNDFVKEDNRIKIIKPTGSSGAGFNRNVGIKYATQKYIGFIDSDDYVDYDYYERLYDAMQIFKADIALSDVMEVVKDDKDVLNELKYHMQLQYSIAEMFKIIQTGSVWDKLYKADLIKKNNIQFLEGVIHEDVPFLMEVFHKTNKLVTAPGSYYYWQRHMNSVTLGEKHNDVRASDAYKVAKYMVGYLKKNQDIPKYESEYIVAWVMTHFGMHAIRDERYNEKMLDLAEGFVDE